MRTNVLIAAAWPYANGSLHLGHISALIGADVLARYNRLVGNNVLFVSGSDCHGTPIVVEADRLGVKPSSIALKYHKEFTRTLIRGLGFSYDLYTTTTTANHVEVVQELFLKLYDDGQIYTKVDDLPHCPNCNRFLPDRLVEGECPHCHFREARGDQCDECGRLLNPEDLVKPKCKVCGDAPEWKPSEHFYLKLSAFQSFLEGWVGESEGWRPNADGFTEKFLAQGLHDRAITRDTTWGVPIPIPGYDDKRIYVWFDAVCGYLSASKEWSVSKGQPELWREWWEDDKAIHYYVHGKDNILFHTVIWPSILHGFGGLHLPDRIISSEYLTLERKQFSKSRHWAVWLPDFIKDFDPETLRFYLVLAGPETADADFTWSDFRLRVNSELIGKFGNFINRVLALVRKSFPEGVRYPSSLSTDQAEFVDHAGRCFETVGSAIERGKFRVAFKEALSLAEHGNRYINTVEPWESSKTDRNKAEGDLAVAVQVIRCLSILVNPFLPVSSDKIQGQVGEGRVETWEQPVPRDIFAANEPRPLYRRVEQVEVDEQRSRLGKGG